MTHVTLKTAAEFIKTEQSTPELDALLTGNAETIDFERERANRPSRFIEIVNEYRNGVPVATIIAKYQCSRGTVLRYARLAGLPTRPKHFPVERKAQVLAMYALGRPVAEIAAALGVSTAYVSKTAVEEGINRRTFK